MDNAGSTAFEVIAKLPLTLPVDSGAKMMLKVAFAPALSASGVESPLRLNPAPLTTACETVTLEDVLLVSVTV